MLIDYLDISLFGLNVTKSSGWFSAPKIKRPYQYSFPDAHGQEIDLSKKFLEPRVIDIEFIMIAGNASDYYNKMALFTEHLQQPGLRVIKHGSIARPYFVYADDSVETEELTKFGSTQMAGRFKVRFIEPNPVGRYFATSNPIENVSFTISCSEPITIHWGDGSSQVVLGTNQSVSHVYNPNLLGTSGSCNNFTGWTQGTSISISGDGSLGSDYCFEHARVGVDISTYINLEDKGLIKSKSYFLAGYARQLAGSLGARINWGTDSTQNIIINSPTWLRGGRAVIYSSTLPVNRLYLNANGDENTSRFDNILLIKIADAERVLLTSQQLLDKYAYNASTTSSGAYTNYVAIVGDLSKITLLSNLTGITAIV